MKTAMCSTLILRTGAGSIFWSAPTIFSTSHQRVATRTTSTSRWIGSGAMTNIETAKNKDRRMNRVTHFEIYTDDPEAVQPFYQNVFGWKFQKFEGGPIEYWLVTTGDDEEPGINGGVTRPREGQSPGTLNTIAVSSLDQTIRKIE